MSSFTRTIHLEEPTLKAFTIHPGIVGTKGYRAAGDAMGEPPKEAQQTVDDVIPNIVNVIDTATKEETSGWMWNK
ncbi:hypothetical protein IAR50_000598 [Cryptococcus sp. DSM 104548]